jgi:hypothetical protein
VAAAVETGPVAVDAIKRYVGLHDFPKDIWRWRGGGWTGRAARLKIAAICTTYFQIYYPGRLPRVT